MSVTQVQQGLTRPVARRNTGRRYASITAGADYINCEHKYIRGLIAKGLLTGYRVPGSRLIRIDLDELDELMAGGEPA